MTPPDPEENPEPDHPKAGWQEKASRKLEERFTRDEVSRGREPTDF